MASVVNDPGGRKRILFVAPDQSRKAIRLGKCGLKSAEAINRHVEALLAAFATEVAVAVIVWRAATGAGAV